MTMTFDDVVAPVGGARFVAEYLGQKPLHLEGSPDKFASVMRWEVLNRLLGMTTVWSQASLVLMLDKEPVPAGAYCAPAPGRDGGGVMRPDPLKVRAYLRQGATLVANDIDQLTPELSAFCRHLEKALGGKVQANLYLSSKRKQGFKVHYDTHDVFAVHVEGEKVWHVFEGRADAPIAHPAFKSQPQEHHEAAKGELWREVRLTPGDLLYLPRGQYHYALAEEGGCVHVAFGVTYPIGLDAMAPLFDRAVAEPVFRRNLPRDDPAALKARLREMGERLAAALAEDATAEAMRAFIDGFGYERETYDLPDLLDSTRGRFEVRASGVRLVESGGRVGLLKEGERGAVEVPGGVKDMVAWVLGRKAFSRDQLDAAFGSRSQPERDKFLVDMQRMALVRPAA
ncbi:MAG: cupin-like domain-containing protein [Geminicoccaceae bacterium]|nr:cupin-like domain-containing protein [Geminicoccaceae bacterium]